MNSYVARLVATVGAEGYAAALRSTLNFAARKLGVGSAPYEYVQRDVQRNLHAYLRRPKNEIRRIITVGAHFGHEVRDMIRRFPNVKFDLFEASPRYIGPLRKKFKDEPRVNLFNCAVMDKDGTADFFETNLEGSGSILEVGELARASYGMAQREKYSVKARRLDTHVKEQGYAPIDCLWIDVQGAEVAVLRGATHTLTLTHSVFLEVSIHEPLYRDGATMAEIDVLLTQFDFRLVSLGTDHANGTGNAFYVRARR